MSNTTLRVLRAHAVPAIVSFAFLALGLIGVFA